MEFEPAKDEEGKSQETTFELGIVDADGNEKTLFKTSTDKAGSFSVDFKLGEGEKLYERSTGGSVEMKATTNVPDTSNEDE